MTKSEANKLIFNQHGYYIASSGGLYLIGGGKIGICAFEWNAPRHILRVNILADAINGPQMKEIQTLCLLHDIRLKILENS
ncbi:hypothetical protein SBP1_gp090 [Vibrio virus vB_VspP_SBP1]|uniref:Uncharacterized protein n=1 Tax=Vibrio virus vB_VspP_SBP1 TaxID=2500581 RepID=A0A3T0IIN4_9CAUD|nr:hypothetical protein KNU36_gp039 [Vibrio virus vB_VspP_SBP1]AZU99682.1 hypothetical protein SBP1_gp090 [Vibrio virus vB_VspP_SBP1]